MPTSRKSTPRKRAAGKTPVTDAVVAASSPMSPMRYLRSSTPSADFQPSAIRWEPPIYAALKEASTYTNTSMNLIVNEAVAKHLASPEVRAQVQAAKSANTSSALDDVISRLSGGDD